MDTVKMFREAAAALQQDPRYLALVEVRRKNDADQQLDQLTKDFSETRIHLSEELEKGIRDNDLVVELNAKANKLYGDIMSHEGIIAYNKAKVEVDSLISHIDAIITAALEGQDPMTVEKPQPQKQKGSCAGDCSACSSACSK